MTKAVKNLTPTKAQFSAFERAYDYFNAKLFNNELPAVLLNLSRKSTAMGFAAPFRWRQAEDTGSAGTVHEISINPEILHLSEVDIYSTLVHEMCHIWQFAFGERSRNGYHNKEWANKMESVGLTPSSTGKPGGNRTGQNMSDYPTPDGVFLAALESMPLDCRFKLLTNEGEIRGVISALTAASEEESEEEGDSGETKPDKPKNKVKYRCIPCEVNAWGKPGLKLICGECMKPFSEIG